ncbi:hypothetical protein [Pontibacter rugosus]
MSLEQRNDRPAIMKAVRQHEFGGPEVLRYEDAPMPEIKKEKSWLK